MLTYAQKLRDPRWQKKRLQILERDNWKCQSCGSTRKNLQVHHLYYVKQDPWKYPDKAYQTLCEECHEVRHLVIDDWINDIRVGLKEVPTGRLDSVLSAALHLVQSSPKLNHKSETPEAKLEPKKIPSPEEARKIFDAMRAGSFEAELQKPKPDLFAAMRAAAGCSKPEDGK